MSTELLNIDCMTYMATLEDNAFDLAIVDPPYGINAAEVLSGPRRKSVNGAAMKSAFDKKNWDKMPPPPIYFKELIRVSREFVIWGANHFISSVPVDSSCWIVWDKDNGTTNFADCELALTSFDTAVRKFTYTWNGMLQGDMKNKETRIHPTQKPVALYKWLLKNYAKPGQRILDTHLGSGSSAIAAHYFGCDFVGCELDKDYFDAASARFKKETRQIDMFGVKQ